jgi:hypothetical protein
VSQVKRIVLCVLAMLALSAVVASTASAASPAWWVTGKILKTGEKEAVAETTKVTTAFAIKGSGFGVQCPSVKLEKAYIEGENTGAVNSIVTSGCTDTAQPTCKVENPINMKPLSVLLEGNTKSLKLNFTPITGKEVATINVSGSECGPTKIVLEGTMACNYPGVETEATEHELEFTAGSGSTLKALGKTAELTGVDRFWLTSGLKWSAR